MAFKKQTKKYPHILETWGGNGGCTVGSIFQLFCVFFHVFFENLPALLSSLCRLVASSGFGAEREQLDEGAEEGVQPALVGHALLHHFLLTWVLSCLLNGVGLGKEAQIWCPVSKPGSLLQILLY